ncbi:MAG: 5-(carboxyamino)imidazole ribonucleotide mutase [Kiritimatiellae bacterium]|nr:5-(carboxyamino)imidazole ribonucleotide mutase [Kiritimatiellia bacterium]
MKKAQPQVAVLMGSQSDWPVVGETVKVLEEFGVACDAQVISAHRTPEEAARFAKAAAGRGIRVIIAAAGSAAHLAGVLAAHTLVPIIGIPMKGGALDGLDALLATVQMPAGVPVATVALGSAGAVNAALLAVQIMALSDPRLRKKLEQHRISLKKKVRKGNQAIRKELKGKK